MHRQNDDFNVGTAGFDAACRLEAIQTRHRDVHKNNLRSKLMIQAHGLFAVLSLTDEVEVAFLFGKPSDGSSKPRIVINEQDVQRHDKKGIKAWRKFNNRVNTEV